MYPALKRGNTSISLACVLFARLAFANLSLRLLSQKWGFVTITTEVSNELLSIFEFALDRFCGPSSSFVRELMDILFRRVEPWGFWWRFPFVAPNSIDYPPGSVSLANEMVLVCKYEPVRAVEDYAWLTWTPTGYRFTCYVVEYEEDN